MDDFKHDYNKVIEACAESLQKEFGFNPTQVLRHFQIFPMNYFQNTPDVPEKERENWYYLREALSHAALIFNFETMKFKLIDPEYKWVGEFIKEFQKSEEQLVEENKIYVERMETIKESFTYKKLDSLIRWYFACPDVTLRNVLPSPKEFILMVLQKYNKELKLKNDDNLTKIRDSLLDAYHYEERMKKFKKLHSSNNSE